MQQEKQHNCLCPKISFDKTNWICVTRMWLSLSLFANLYLRNSDQGWFRVALIDGALFCWTCAPGVAIHEPFQSFTYLNTAMTIRQWHATFELAQWQAKYFAFTLKQWNWGTNSSKPPGKKLNEQNQNLYVCKRREFHHNDQVKLNLDAIESCLNWSSLTASAETNWHGWYR